MPGSSTVPQIVRAELLILALIESNWATIVLVIMGVFANSQSAQFKRWAGKAQRDTSDKIHLVDHIMENPEFFGNDFQLSIQTKCLHAWPAFHTNTKIGFNGRNFGWDNPTIEDVDAIADMANTFGAVSTFFTSQALCHSLIEQFNARGLAVGIWQQLTSFDATYTMCESILENFIEDEFHFELIGPSTPADEVQEFQSLMQSCGVAPCQGMFCEELRSEAHR